MRFPPDFLSVYEESAGGRDANVRLRHPDPPEGAERSAWYLPGLGDGPRRSHQQLALLGAARGGAGERARARGDRRRDRVPGPRASPGRRFCSERARRSGSPAPRGRCTPRSSEPRRRPCAPGTVGRPSVLGDRVDDLAARHRAGGRGPCPRSSSAGRRGIALAVARPPEGRIILSTVPWMTRVGALICAELFGPVARGDDRAELAAARADVEAAVVAAAGALADVLLVARRSRSSRPGRRPRPSAGCSRRGRGAAAAAGSGRQTAPAGRAGGCRWWT